MLDNILECEYIENFGKWEIQKKKLFEKYEKKYSNKKIRVKRVKTDTKGLRCYIVEEVR